MFQIAHPVDVKTGSPASLEKLTSRQFQEKKKKRPFVGEGNNYSRGVDEGKKLPPAIGTEVDRQEQKQKQQHSEAEAERDDLSVRGGEGDKMLSPARKKARTEDKGKEIDEEFSSPFGSDLKKARTEDKGKEIDEEFSSPFGSDLCQSPACQSPGSPRVIEDDISKLDEDPPDELLDEVPQYFREIMKLPPKPFCRDYPGKTLYDLFLEHEEYIAAMYADLKGTLKLIEEATKNFEQDAKAPNYYYYYGGPLPIATPDSIMGKAPSSKSPSSK